MESTNIMSMVVFLVIVAVVIFMLVQSFSRSRQLQKYWDIKLGMSEEEMLEIMGEGYNRSMLKNERIKYEWRIEAKNYRFNIFGMRGNHHEGVKKVTIYTKDGIVEEIKPYNV